MGTVNQGLDAHHDQTQPDPAEPSPALSGLVEMLLAMMPDAAVAVDADGHIVAVNTDAEALFGYQGSDLFGEAIEMLIPEPSGAVHPQFRAGDLDAPSARGRALRAGLAGRRRDGTHFPADIRVAPVGSSDPPLRVAAIRDLSGYESEIVTSAHLAAIVESSSEAIVGLTLDGEIRSWNAGATRLFAYRPAEILGEPIARLSPPDSPAQLREMLAAVAAGQPVSPRDMKWSTKSGRRVHVAVSVSPTKGPTDQLTGFSVIARDITERKRAEAELRRQERWQAATGEIRLAMLSNLPGTAVFDVICRRARELLGAGSAAILLDLPEGLRVAGAAGSAAALIGQILSRLPPPLQPVLAEGVTRTGSIEQPVEDKEDAALLGRGLFLAVPIWSERANGVLLASRGTGGAPFSTGEVGLVEGFGAAAALAIELSRARADREQLLVVADRERIARDLHDLVIQRLFGTGMSLQRVVAMVGDVDTDISDRLQSAIEGIDSTIQEIRTAIFALQPPPATAGGLRSQILRLAADSTEPLGFRPRVHFRGPVDSAVTDALAGEVLAVIREALSNVARHASAGAATVEVRADTELAVVVTDNGVGLGEPVAESGLANMRARAAHMGGALALSAGDAGGTVVTWRVPLAE